MFTGIVEEIGTVNKIKRGQHSAVLEIGAKTILEDVKAGDSIAVNGICLTVTALHSGAFTADVMHETLNRSALTSIVLGSHVNLERAMKANGRFGGHMVSGHIDGTGKIIGIQKDDTAIWFTIQTKPEILNYIEKDSFSVSAIPHTVKQTILHERKEGSFVNLEADVIGKYIEKLLSISLKQQTSSLITKDFLTKYGF